MMEALFAGTESLVSKSNTNEIEFYDNNERKHKSNFYSLFSELKQPGFTNYWLRQIQVPVERTGRFLNL